VALSAIVEGGENFLVVLRLRPQLRAALVRMLLAKIAENHRNALPAKKFHVQNQT